ncbi:MAG TPA: hypothetical protein VLB68_27715 [Pyrinomonadaceae bacterium]|nr:hypothetical protein [Pyrinomonadaceae bacterium]
MLAIPFRILIVLLLFLSSVALAQETRNNHKAVVEEVAQNSETREPSNNPTVGKTTPPAEKKSEPVNTTAPAPSDDSEGWHFESAPYVWLAGIDGNLRIRNTTVQVDSSPSDLLEQLDFAFATQFEAGKGRFKIILDENYVNLGATGTGPLGQVTDVQPTLNIFEFGGSYAPVVIANKEATTTKPLPAVFSLEIIGGGRYTHFGLGLTRPNFSTEGSRNLVDAFIGNRFKVRPHPAVTLIGKYTVGGGGSHFAWTAAGLVDLRWKKSFSVWGGYQLLDMDADQASNTIGFNGRLKGLVMGVTLYR